MQHRSRPGPSHASGAPAAALARALLLIFLLLLLAPSAARAQTSCSPPDARGASECRAELAEAVVARMLQTQERSRWCWAAAISMVFARYGYPVAQSDIVERMYGLAVDAGVPTHVLPAVIDRDWVSDGLPVKASTRYQAAAPGATVPASLTLMVSSLRAGHPLILSAQGHAVVVVGVTYRGLGQAFRITGGTVIDPTPGVGLRPLQAEELGVALLASVDVAPVAGGRPAAAVAALLPAAYDR